MFQVRMLKRRKYYDGAKNVNDERNLKSKISSVTREKIFMCVQRKKKLHVIRGRQDDKSSEVEIL